MNLLLGILIGAGVGVVLATITERQDDLMIGVFAGIAGSVGAGALFALLSSGPESWMIFSWPSLFWSLGGALFAAIFTYVLQHYSQQEA